MPRLRLRRSTRAPASRATSLVRSREPSSITSTSRDCARNSRSTPPRASCSLYAGTITSNRTLHAGASYITAGRSRGMWPNAWLHNRRRDVYGPPGSMCGVFGVVCTNDGRVERELAHALAISLLRHSETRGRDAAGIAVHAGAQLQVLKQSGTVSEFLANPKLHQLLERGLAAFTAGKPIAITGHSRHVTKGKQSDVHNTQPVLTGGADALHNGIVVTDRKLLARYTVQAQGAFVCVVFV